MDTLTDRLRVQDPFPYGHFVENELNVFWTFIFIPPIVM